MNKNIFIIGISLGLMISILVFILVSVSCVSTGSEKDKSANYVQKKEMTDNFIADISYPKINDLDILNEAVEQYVLGRLEQIKKDSKDGENPYEYIVTSEIFSSGNIVSVLLNAYEYAGGANGELKLKTFNYDTKENKFIDILQASGYSLVELSEKSREILTKSFLSEYKDMIQSGTTPTEDSFKNYVLDKDKLLIYFEPAVVAPHSEGVQFVSITLSESEKKDSL